MHDLASLITIGDTIDLSIIPPLFLLQIDPPYFKASSTKSSMYFGLFFSGNGVILTDFSLIIKSLLL